MTLGPNVPGRRADCPICGPRLFPAGFRALSEKKKGVYALCGICRASVFDAPIRMFFGRFGVLSEDGAGGFALDAPKYLKSMSNLPTSQFEAVCTLYRVIVEYRHSWLFVLGSS